jgi:hypothetical protein
VISKSDLYLVGAETLGERVIKGRYLLSTDATSPGGCGTLVLGGSALDIQPAGPLGFNLLVQSPIVSDDGGDLFKFIEEAEPHSRVRLAWATGKGFVASTPETAGPEISLPPLIPKTDLDLMDRPAARTVIGDQDHSVEVHVSGRGKSIVFLSPVPGSTEDLSSDFRVVSLFMAAEDIGSPRSLEDTLKVFDAFGIRDAIVVGVGPTRGVALDFARAYPDRIFGVGLAGARSADEAGARLGLLRPVKELGTNLKVTLRDFLQSR